MSENAFRAFQRAEMSPQDTQLNTVSCIFLPKIKLNTVKHVLSGHSKRRPKLGFQDPLSLNAASVCHQDWIYFFEWDLKTGFTVTIKLYLLPQLVLTCVFAYM